MVDVKWSDNTAFPIETSPAPTDHVMGLVSGANAKIPIEDLPVGVSITDGTHTVAGTTSLTVTGGTVGGTTPNATLDVSGGAAVPLPFFGNIPSTGWSRPALSTFSTWLNQSGATATDNAGGLPLVIETPAGGSALTGKLKTIGAPPWTITAAMVIAGLNAGAYGSIILYNTIADKAVVLDWSFQGPGFVTGGGAQVDYVTPTSSYTISSTPIALVSVTLGYFVWFKIINDGTNLTFQQSADGIYFYNIGSPILAAAFAASFDKVGFGTNASNNAGDAMVGLWQWVES